MSVNSKQALCTLWIAVAITGCGGNGGGGDGVPASPAPGPGSSSTSSVASSSSSVASSAPTTVNSLGATGWATYGTGTTGGHGAVSGKTYTVTNRKELVQALYPDAVMSADGSFTSVAGADTAKKIIYVSGSIDLNVDASNVAITEDQYLARNSCLSTLQATTPSITNAATFWTAYKAAYAPNVWNTSLVSGKPPKLTGALETARACASGNQTKIVRIDIGSNTSIIGVGSTAKIARGNLSISTGMDNVVIRNITFEDSFDYWPAWDPTDSFPTATATPDPATGCSTTAITKCVGGRWNSNYDLISVAGATHVWIDHNTLSDGTNIDKLYPPVPTWDFGGNAQLPEQKIQHHDGLIDVNVGANYVTMSNNYLKDHDKTGLVGGGDSASLIESPLLYAVTFNNNYYQNNKQRQPRARFGRIHVYNNYYVGQLANADGSGPNYAWSVAWTNGTVSKLYLENNVLDIANSPDGLITPIIDKHVINPSFSASNQTKCTAVASKPWVNTDCVTTVYDSGNLLNGALIDVYAGSMITNSPVISNEKAAATKYWQPSLFYSYTLMDASVVKASVIANAGAGKL